MYAAMGMNRDNRAEIHDAACVRTGIIMRLRIAKSARNEADKKDD